MVKNEKLKKKMEEIDKFRTEMGKKTGLTASSVDIIRRDRDHVH
jgi:hypothetical protein